MANRPALSLCPMVEPESAPEHAAQRIRGYVRGLARLTVTTAAVADPALEAHCDQYPDEYVWACDDGDRHLVRVLCPCDHATDLTREEAACFAGVLLGAVEDTLSRGRLRLNEVVALLRALAPVSETLADLRARALADVRADPIPDLDPLASRLLDTPQGRGTAPSSGRLPSTSPTG